MNEFQAPRSAHQDRQMSDFRKEFIAFCIDCGVLRFGQFKTKAGRMSPYFFNAGLFNDGAMLWRLGQFYAKAILAAGHPFDMLFGPAYKGIPLAASVAIALAQAGRNVPYSFNRKEAKDHGEGGRTIGAPLAGRVLIVDDVISAGTSVRESVELIGASSARPCGVAIALDRMERGAGERSAVQEVREHFGLPVMAIADLGDLVQFLGSKPDLAPALIEIERYRQLYGAVAHA
jgi:orotate phosphoribosyltransferase